MKKFRIKNSKNSILASFIAMSFFSPLFGLAMANKTISSYSQLLPVFTMRTNLENKNELAEKHRHYVERRFKVSPFHDGSRHTKSFGVNHKSDLEQALLTQIDEFKQIVSDIDYLNALPENSLKLQLLYYKILFASITRNNFRLTSHPNEPFEGLSSALSWIGNNHHDLTRLDGQHQDLEKYIDFYESILSGLTNIDSLNQPELIDSHQKTTDAVCKETLNSDESNRQMSFLEEEVVTHFPSGKTSSKTARIFKCPHPDCRYRTAVRSHRKRHLLTHTNDKPHICYLCGHGFRTKYHLKSHISTIHENKKPHACPLCDYRANKKAQVENHIRSNHTYERPFPCPILGCSYRGRQRRTTEIHMKRKHPKKYREMNSDVHRKVFLNKIPRIPSEQANLY